eukprot:gene5524-52920_t
MAGCMREYWGGAPHPKRARPPFDPTQVMELTALS